MKIKKIIKKIDEDIFSEPIPIGADGKNIDLEEGVNLEEKLTQIQEQLKSLQTTLTWRSIKGE